MSVPITGVLLIPLGLLLVLLPWRYCLIGLTTFAMLSPAAVVNYGKFGLQPGYYISILIIGRIAAEIMVQRFAMNAFVLRRLALLMYFVIIIFVVLFLALCFFQGQIEVLPGSSGFKSVATQRFHFSKENIAQMGYLLCNACLLYCMAHKAATLPVGKLLREWDMAVVAGLVFSALVCLWQFLSLYKGVPFPTDFFYSNAGYSRADSQSMVGLFRINGPFEEPSTVGYTFSGYLLFAWIRYRLYPTAFTVGLITASALCMVLSTSTTAFAGLVITFCVGTLDILTGRLHLMSRDFRLCSGQVAAIFIIVVGGIGGAIVVAANWNAIHIILEDEVFHKSDSTSFHQRMFADVLALKVFVESYGLGLGLGSDKGNSLLTSLLANTGVVGTTVLGLFFYQTIRRVRLVADPATKDSLRRRTDPFRWSVIGLLIMHAISNPNLSTLTIWVMIGGVIAIEASLRRAGLTPASAARLRNIPLRIRMAAPLVHRAHSGGHPLAS